MVNVVIEENVTVPSADGYELAVDISRPADAVGSAPGLLFLPGGGWVAANREPLKARYGRPMAERGFVCVTGEYRVLEQARWPAAIQDVKSILRWMRANSGYLGIDSERIAVGGKSAGGHLALLAAAANGRPEYEGNGPNAAFSSRVAAAIAVAAVSDIREYWRRESLAPYIANDSSAAALTAANPVELVNPHFPPTLLLHGANDDRVPHAMTQQMFAALEQAGVAADLRIFAGQDHMFDQLPEFSQAIVESMALFLARYAAAPAAEPALADD